MSLGGGFSKSKQSSNSDSGLRGTPYFDRFAHNVSDTGNQANALAQQYANSPFGYFQGKSVNELVPTDDSGLPVELSNALGFATKQMYNKASAGGAARGQLSMANTPGIVGSALQNLAQFLTPHILDFKKYMVGLPDTLMNSRLGFLQNTMGASGPLVGSTSAYRGDSFSMSAFGSGTGGKG